MNMPTVRGQALCLVCAIGVAASCGPGPAASQGGTPATMRPPASASASAPTSATAAILPTAGPTTTGAPPPTTPVATAAPSPSPTIAPEVGIAWTTVTDADLVAAPRWGSMYGVVAGGPGAIAWGEVYLAGPRIWTTTDGRDWSPAAVEAPADAEADYPGAVLDVTRGGPGYVAVGVYGRAGGDGATAIVWTSVDGTVWQRVPFGPAFERSQIDQVIGWRGALLAFGCENESPTDCGPARVWTSPDGMTWTRSAPVLPEGVNGLGIVVPADDRLWGKGGTGTDTALTENSPKPTRITSTDGLTWTKAELSVVGVERLHPLPGGLYLTVAAIPSGNPDFVEPPAWVSRVPGVYRSTDEVGWEPLAVGKELGGEIIAVGDTLVMVGANAKGRPTAWRSTDAGRTWTAVVAGPAKGSMTAVAALPDGTLVAVGKADATGTAAWVSAPVRP